MVTYLCLSTSSNYVLIQMVSNEIAHGKCSFILIGLVRIAREKTGHTQSKTTSKTKETSKRSRFLTERAQVIEVRKIIRNYPMIF